MISHLLFPEDYQQCFFFLWCKLSQLEEVIDKLVLVVVNVEAVVLCRILTSEWSQV